MASKDRYAKDYPFAKGWPSVTQILGVKDVGLASWYGYVGNKEANRIKEQAALIGHMADEYRDAYFESSNSVIDMRELHDDSKKYFKQVKENIDKFHDHYKPERVRTQLVVYSPTKKYIGSFDDIYKIKGKLVLADAKATNRLKKAYEYQVEAYYRAVNEMMDLKILQIDGEWAKNCLWLTQFPKKEKWQASKHVLKISPSIDRYQRGFLTLLTHLYFEKEEKVAK